jgi:hypothetical protein
VDKIEFISLSLQVHKAATMSRRSSGTRTPPSSQFAYPSNVYSLDEEQLYTISAALITDPDMHSTRNLDDVPEEGQSNAGMYMNRSAASSASTFHAVPGPASATIPGPAGSGSGSGRSTPIPGAQGGVAQSSRPRRAASSRTMGHKASSEQLQAAPGSGNGGGGSSANGHGSVRRTGSTASGLSKSTTRLRSENQQLPRYRSIPRLPHDKEAPPAPTTGMYWSRAPAWGTMPTRQLRSLSATLVDSVVWIIGGNEDKDRSRDIYCFDTGESQFTASCSFQAHICVETMQWSHPDTVGDIPPPCRAHTATLVDNKKIVVYGGGLGSIYHDTVYILDVATRRWTQPAILDGPRPAERRAHTAGYYDGKLWIFGGGNGMRALDDLWTLSLGPNQHGVEGPDKKRGLKWEEMATTGRKPGRRGYHTSSFIGNKMVTVGGSDGKDCFTDIWILNLGMCLSSSVCVLR